MNQEEATERLKSELGFPRLPLELDQEEYSEDEYQQIKKQLLDYFTDYVQNVEH